jgi:hypothetical protein
MPNSKLADDIAARFAAFMSGSPAKEAEKNVRALLSAGFARLDLVTREEFEIQRELLARAQEKIASMEARLAELEGRLGGKG